MGTGMVGSRHRLEGDGVEGELRLGEASVACTAGPRGGVPSAVRAAGGRVTVFDVGRHAAAELPAALLLLWWTYLLKKHDFHIVPPLRTGSRDRSRCGGGSETQRIDFKTWSCCASDGAQRVGQGRRHLGDATNGREGGRYS